jgi:putative hemolysin
MNRIRPYSLRALLCALPLAGALAGCGTPAYEVVTYPDGKTRTPTTADAVGYCKQRGLTAQILDRAPGETGVMFRCN